MTILENPPAESAPADRTDGLLARIGRLSARRPRRVLAVWALVVLVAAPLAVTLTSALSGAGWEAQGSTAQEVRDELRRDFPQLGAEAAIVVYRQADPIADSPEGLATLVAALQGSPGTTAVVDPLLQPAEAGLISRDGRAALVPVALEASADADLPESAGEVMETVASVPLPDGAEADATGEWAVWHDFNVINEKALHKAELLSGLPTLILLFLAFGTAIAAGLPLLLAVAGIAVGFAALRSGSLWPFVTSTRSPSMTSTAGRRVSEAAAVATTDRIMPRAIDRNTMIGTRKMAASDRTTVSAERNTAFPAVASVPATASSGAFPSSRSSR